jgi:hypothetical protein
VRGTDHFLIVFMAEVPYLRGERPVWVEESLDILLKRSDHHRLSKLEREWMMLLHLIGNFFA